MVKIISMMIVPFMLTIGMYFFLHNHEVPQGLTQTESSFLRLKPAQPMKDLDALLSQGKKTTNADNGLSSSFIKQPGISIPQQTASEAAQGANNGANKGGAASASAGAGNTAPVFRVTLIMKTDGKYAAIVNSKVVKVGSKVGAHKVTNIKDDGVMLTMDNSKEWISFNKK
ncbi:MAG: hypothetical protein L7F77_12550 [Candidatus Magnetominusculus sp. LBB02]|nr:hypothetical protein [Candidatus Magnetominusculus sp. LBB02]MCG6553145.1 hypothetical protein [Candidatus Magnetominusculus sp. LBB02]